MGTSNWSTTFNPGPNTYPATGGLPAAGITEAKLTVDRTVAGGLNSLTTATVVSVNVMATGVSNPQPSDWYVLVGSTWIGGIQTRPQSRGAQPTQVNEQEMSASSDGSVLQIQVQAEVAGGVAVNLGGQLITNP